MAQPQYVVKRFGNDYKIIRSDTEGVVMSGLAIAAGSIIALKGLKRFSLFGPPGTIFFDHIHTWNSQRNGIVRHDL